MDALEDFHLTFIGANYFERFRRRYQPPSPFKRTYLPSVRRLQVELSVSGYDYPCSKNLLQILFASLFFPGTTDLSLVLNGIIYAGVEDVSLDAEMMLLFQHFDMFSRVERFRLKAINSQSSSKSSFSVSIPFWTLPNLKELSLCCNIRLIPRNDFAGKYASPALQMLIIESTEVGLRALGPFVKSVIKRQEEDGRWGSSHELVIINADTLHYIHQMVTKRCTTKTFAGDAAIRWCTNGVPEIPAFDETGDSCIIS
ncbi:hypothetical protein SCHPADRAFT_270569 [Schizopora paradoxa]|uniref:Uncharacterized protein n=1 Tax=Schizopora paradoxa TaxID=27342 RepID=A0A0H2SE71_9AGAM|nr:hypothetical protein SCHPADRAFT_270569 [Schizopora paradoxa]